MSADFIEFIRVSGLGGQGWQAGLKKRLFRPAVVSQKLANPGICGFFLPLCDARK